MQVLPAAAHRIVHVVVVIMMIMRTEEADLGTVVLCLFRCTLPMKSLPVCRIC